VRAVAPALRTYKDWKIAGKPLKRLDTIEPPKDVLLKEQRDHAQAVGPHDDHACRGSDAGRLLSRNRERQCPPGAQARHG
jgi:hypothetical protein